MRGSRYLSSAVTAAGAYLTNSGLQFAAVCRVAGITPILFLTRDASRHGQIEEYRELARHQGIFAGPVYTGKGLAGMLDHARTGRIPPGSNVAFLHTGDTGNLFEITQVTGDITR